MNIQPRKKGRPPSQQSREAIFRSTMELLMELGLRRMTIDKIAERAGVSKATIYRWWSDKTALSMEAFIYHVQLEGVVLDLGSFVADFADWFKKLNRFYASPEGRVLAQIMAESQSSSEMLFPFQEQLRQLLKQKCMLMWNRALERGEIDESADAQLVIELISSPSSCRMLSNQPVLDDKSTEQMLNIVFNGIRRR